MHEVGKKWSKRSWPVQRNTPVVFATLLLCYRIVTIAELRMAGAARLLVLAWQGQPPQSSAWQALDDPADARQKKENGKGLEQRIKKDLGLK